tara:strand:+ start:359 stop:766 length:408 start_codon:yes stop_codon:yes gene_type:complete
VAILKQIGRNPLDVNKNVRIGVAFPLDDENMFTGTLTTKEQAKANLLNVLLTYPGERINMPNFGVGLKKLLFETKIDLITLKEKVKRQTSFYVPNIKVRDVKTQISQDKRTLFVSIYFTNIADNTSDAIQINFNQ